jgi:hypothetical protein
VIDNIIVYQTFDPQPSKKLLELPLSGESSEQIWSSGV